MQTEALIGRPTMVLMDLQRLRNFNQVLGLIATAGNLMKMAILWTLGALYLQVGSHLNNELCQTHQLSDHIKNMKFCSRSPTLTQVLLLHGSGNRVEAHSINYQWV